jgi:hypothetical protein
VIDRWMGRVIALVTVLVLGLAIYAGYRLARAHARAEVYRARLDELATQHQALRGRYNQAVERTAVTELVVNDGKLSVVVVTAEHEIRRIDTPFDPNSEIHVDFVVIDGRLWIRRIHDSDTPASKGLLIDPALASIDWSDDARRGLAIYRPLGEGRWVVSVSGNGALTLESAPPKERTQLSAGAPVDDYPTIADEAAGASADDIGVIDTLKALLFPLEDAPSSS